MPPLNIVGLKPTRLIFALILLPVLSIFMISLGNWQLRRAAEKQTILTQITQAAAHPVQRFDAQQLTATASDNLRYRHILIRGSWLADKGVFIDNRIHQGQPGYWLVMPLKLSETVSNSVGSDFALPAAAPKPPVIIETSALPSRAGQRQGARNTGTGVYSSVNEDSEYRATPYLGRAVGGAEVIVLVNRGWFPKQLGQIPNLNQLPTPSTEIDIQGQVLDHLPRFISLESSPSTLIGGVWQNFSIQRYQQISGLNVLPFILQADQSNPTDLLQETFTPALDPDKNRGYAYQWFSFAAIAGIAFLILCWRLIRLYFKKPSNKVE